MKILVIHNHYLEKGGEDDVVSAEVSLLKEHGHKVFLYEKSNKSIESLSFFKKLVFVLRDLSFSKVVYREIKDIVKAEKPDIAHVHNIFICITPAVYLVLKNENIPIVQTLHNYRFFCLRGIFFRNRKVCEKCRKGKFLNSVFGKCWKNSFILSFYLAKLLYRAGSFLKIIDSYIVLSKFSMNKFIKLGLDEKKLYLKPNFVEAKSIDDGVLDKNYALFIGRLVDYKGIKTLIKAIMINHSFNFKIIGDGPLRREVCNLASLYNNVEWLGRLERDSVFREIMNSSFLIFPSECFETMGMVVIESFAFSKPVLASNLGAASELINDGESGILFEAGNAKDLAEKISYLFSHKKERIEMGKKANKIYSAMFDKNYNYKELIRVYTETINSKGTG
jgi:glycosyltransferase involved in cell wall biosynthesis